jgi:hypothetical protein
MTEAVFNGEMESMSGSSLHIDCWTVTWRGIRSYGMVGSVCSIPLSSDLLSIDPFICCIQVGRAGV